jgi:DNA invertase Pin-like site-specific DNA recombinase
MTQTLPPPTIIEAVSYIRWSSDKQGDGTSLPRQRKVNRDGAATMGWAITREIRDEGVSAFFGTNLEDGQLGEFIRQCEREGGHGKALTAKEGPLP